MCKTQRFNLVTRVAKAAGVKRSDVELETWPYADGTDWHTVTIGNVGYQSSESIEDALTRALFCMELIK